jgi:hypothetical protein
MVDPIISKLPAKPVSNVGEDSATPGIKTGESKFDKVRARLQEEQAQSVQLPPEVKQISPEQTRALQANLNQRVQQTKSTSAPELFGKDISQAKSRIDHLRTRVEALPKTSAFDPLRQRLTSIDNQYQNAGKLIHTLTGQQTPAELMQVQMQMYQMSENLELMSKVVEQVSSGVKSVLQTNL